MHSFNQSSSLLLDWPWRPYLYPMKLLHAGPAFTATVMPQFVLGEQQLNRTCAIALPAKPSSTLTSVSTAVYQLGQQRDVPGSDLGPHGQSPGQNFVSSGGQRHPFISPSGKDPICCCTP
jgi:hypothetical protein